MLFIDKYLLRTSNPLEIERIVCDISTCGQLNN